MATISERLAYILTFDTSSGIKSLEQLGKTADKELSKADQKLDKLGSNMQKFGAGAVAAAGVAGVGLFKLASGAADAEANMAALEQVVGEAVAHDVGKWAENSAKGVGMASKDAVAAATSFAQLGKIIGLGGEDLSKFSTDLVGLSADFAAFKNVSPEQALQDVSAAFAGSTEVMRKYGIFLDDATLKSAYFRETGEKVTGTLSAQQKIVAINAEMYRQGADMLGQWGRESGELAGQQAILKAELTNLGDAIGAGVLPHVTKLMSGMTSLASGIASIDKATAGTVGSLATFGVGLLALGGGLSFVVGKAITMRENLAKLTTALHAGVGAGTLAGVAMLGFALHTQKAAAQAKEAAEALEDLGRAADEEIGQKFGKALIEGALVAGGFDKSLANIVKTSPGVVARMLEIEDASGGLTEQFMANGMSAEDAADWIDKLRVALDAEKDALAENAKTTEATTKIQEEATAATEDGTKATDAAAEAQKAAAARARELASGFRDAARDAAALRTANEVLRGELDNREAYLNLLNTLDSVQVAAEEAFYAAASGAEEAEQKARDYELAQIGLKNAVLDYSDQLGKLPQEKVTNIISLIDQGSLEEAERRLEVLTRNRNMSVSIQTKGGIGYGPSNGGPRALGGPTYAGAYHEVFDTDKPELLEEGGKTYLLPAKDGRVTPLTPAATATSSTREGPLIGHVTINGEVDVELVAKRLLFAMASGA